MREFFPREEVAHYQYIIYLRGQREISLSGTGKDELVKYIGSSTLRVEEPMYFTSQDFTVQSQSGSSQDVPYSKDGRFPPC